MNKTIVIEFDSEIAAGHFASWFCGQGEQSYWDWMEYREEEEEGDITAVSFHYHGIEDKRLSNTDPNRYGPFMGDSTIRTISGRLDDKAVYKAGDE